MENIVAKSQIHGNTLAPFIRVLRISLLIFTLLLTQNLFAQNNPKAEKEFKKALDYMNSGKEDKAIESLNKVFEIAKDNSGLISNM